MTRYLSGLCVAGLGLFGGGWLVVAAVAFGGESAGRAQRVNLLTGAVLIGVCCLSLACWSWAWRRRMRADGVLAGRFTKVSRREARRNRSALSADGGVLGEGVAVGVASAGDEPQGAQALYGAGANGAAVHGTGMHGTSVRGAEASGAGGNPGERAAELVSELRSMLEPLLASVGGEPAVAELAALAEQTAAAAPPLPQRTRFASDFRPRVSVTPVPTLIPRARPAPMSIPRLTSAADGYRPGHASDGEGTW
jgi:hypothetical protein